MDLPLLLVDAGTKDHVYPWTTHVSPMSSEMEFGDIVVAIQALYRQVPPVLVSTSISRYGSFSFVIVYVRLATLISSWTGYSAEIGLNSAGADLGLSNARVAFLTMEDGMQQRQTRKNLSTYNNA